MLSDMNFLAEQKANKDILKSRYLEVKRILQDPRYAEILEVIPYNAGYFMSVRLLEKDADEVRKKMLAEYGIGVIVFPNNVVRIAYSSVAKEKVKNIFEALYICCA